MASVTYVKNIYGKWYYGKCIHSKSIMQNVTEPRSDMVLGH